MPTVPVYGGPKVATAPLPSARVEGGAPTAAFQPPAPVDLSPAIQYAQQEKQKGDQVAVLDADNALSDFSRAQESAVRQRRGKDALGATAEVTTAWDQRAGEIEQGLAGDTQKLAFRARAQARRAALLETVERHADAEGRAYDDQTTTGALSNRLNDALASFGDPEKVAGAVAEQRAILLDWGRRNGVAPELLQEKIATAASKTQRAVIERMLANGNDQAATARYGQVKDQIVGEDTLHLEQALESGSSLGEAQRQADAILRPGVSRADAFTAAKAITDPRVRKLTEANLDEAFARQERTTRDAREALFQQAASRAEQSGRRPMDVWWSLTLQEREAIDSRLKQAATGLPVKTDLGTYYDLKSRASSDATKDGFLRENLLLYRARLSESDWKEMVDLQASMRKGDGRADQQLAEFRTHGEIIHSTLAAAGIDPTPKPGSSDAERVAQFTRTIEERVVAQQARTGKKATSQEMQGIADELVTRHVLAGSGWFGTDLFAQRVAPFEVQTIDQVPVAERHKAEAALARAGQPITDATIVALYRRQLARTPK